MRLAEIWRFPVKSMAGERLATAELRRDGIEGDRLVQAWDERRCHRNTAHTSATTMNSSTSLSRRLAMARSMSWLRS